ncbi:hypothetical protein HK100_002285 [Physocladia obscura]|uniref:Calpain catalytic domain-containing protein n=1 Tax=Physocladia obscura TaxID=109957 RepID=A0AAD5XB76_9FUNG|nr:hypothetical protein HK100_002285 [Physocladia obscura]
MPETFAANTNKKEKSSARKAALESVNSKDAKLTFSIDHHWNSVISAAETVSPFEATVSAVPVSESYNSAVVECKARVKDIARQCRDVNSRFRDRSQYFSSSLMYICTKFIRSLYLVAETRFFDVWLNKSDCLNSLQIPDDDDSDKDEDSEKSSEKAGRNQTGTVRRVPALFDKPKFFKDGLSAGDIEQGSEGDCWFLAALSILASNPSLLERIMVARDETVGVYGFVFFRDGKWITSIVDDQLFVNFPEFSDASTALPQEEYERTYLRGSRALKFARCHDENETWVPLVEKAYAKAHGDYEAISGGFGGEAVEDLTGSICSNILVQDILDTDKFWNEEFMRMNEGKVFFTDMFNSKFGLFGGHEYCVLAAKEVNGKRFLLFRNPWGNSEWNGKWSDGSAEWTPEWMTLLGHRFGDDGQFWMEYDDVLKMWDNISIATLFDDSWLMVNSSAELKASFPAEFSATVFDIDATKEGPAYIVLSQLDTRYFKSIEGAFEYRLTFQIVKIDVKTGAETNFKFPPVSSLIDLTRSTKVHVKNLPVGKYRVYPKVSATPLGRTKNIDEIIEYNGKNGLQSKIEAVVKSLTLGKQVSLLRTQKLKKDVVDRIEKEKQKNVDADNEEGKAKDEHEDQVSNAETKDSNENESEAETNKTDNSENDGNENENQKPSHKLSVSAYLRIYTKDPLMKVTTRFLDLESATYVLPECLAKPYGADPTADLYLTYDSVSDFKLSTSASSSYLKQKSSLAAFSKIHVQKEF